MHSEKKTLTTLMSELELLSSLSPSFRNTSQNYYLFSIEKTEILLYTAISTVTSFFHVLITLFAAFLTSKSSHSVFNLFRLNPTSVVSKSFTVSLVSPSSFKAPRVDFTSPVTIKKRTHTEEENARRQENPPPS